MLRPIILETCMLSHAGHTRTVDKPSWFWSNEPVLESREFLRILKFVLHHLVMSSIVSGCRSTFLLNTVLLWKGAQSRCGIHGDPDGQAVLLSL